MVSLFLSPSLSLSFFSVLFFLFCVNFGPIALIDGWTLRRCSLSGQSLLGYVLINPAIYSTAVIIVPPEYIPGFIKTVPKDAAVDHSFVSICQGESANLARIQLFVVQNYL